MFHHEPRPSQSFEDAVEGQLVCSFSSLDQCSKECQTLESSEVLRPQLCVLGWHESTDLSVVLEQGQSHSVRQFGQDLSVTGTSH